MNLSMFINASTLISIAVFALVLLSLVIMVALSHKLLGISGQVVLLLNRERRLHIQKGEKLLNALQAHDIFLPFACGGKGACGQCRVKILQGADPASDTERVTLGRRAVREGMRLACLQTVKRELHIQLSTQLLNTQQYRYRVRSNQRVATFLTELTLEPETGEPMYFQPGDYLMVSAPAYQLAFSSLAMPEHYRRHWAQLGLLSLHVENTATTQRAYSMANAPFESTTIQLLVRIALPPPDGEQRLPPGIVSSFLYQLQPGDNVNVTGPYGTFHLKKNEREKIFIGGGAGMAPLRSMIRELLLHQHHRGPISYWYGARAQEQLCYAEEFQQLAARHSNFRWQVALSEPDADSGWQGHTGFIHHVVDHQYLRQHPNPAACEFYLCGPPVMSAAVIAMLRTYQVPANHIFVDDFGG